MKHLTNLKILLGFIVLSLGFMACNDNVTVTEQSAATATPPPIDLEYATKSGQTENGVDYAANTHSANESICGLTFGRNYDARVLNLDVPVGYIGLIDEALVGFQGSEISVHCGTFIRSLTVLSPNYLFMDMNGAVIDFECWLEDASRFQFDTTEQKSQLTPGKVYTCSVSDSGRSYSFENIANKCGFYMPVELNTGNITYGVLNKGFYVNKVTKATSGKRTSARIELACKDGSSQSPIMFDSWDTSIEAGQTLDFFCAMTGDNGQMLSSTPTCVNIRSLK